MDEFNALFDIRLETLNGNFQQLLLGLSGVLKHIDGFLYTARLYSCQ